MIFLSLDDMKPVLSEYIRSSLSYACAHYTACNYTITLNFYNTAQISLARTHDRHIRPPVERVGRRQGSIAPSEPQSEPD